MPVYEHTTGNQLIAPALFKLIISYIVLAKFFAKNRAMMENRVVSNLTAAQAQARHQELAAEIRRHDHLYYVQARPVISDQEYDRLYRELADLEKEFPATGHAGFAHPTRRR